MKLNIGENLRRLRRAADMTQEQLADKLGVAYQSVSRWENGTTYPDMEFLPVLAGIFGVTVDELLCGKAEPEVQLVPEAQRKDIKDMMLRMKVDTGDGDRVRISVPMALVQVAAETGMAMPQVNGNPALQQIDFAQILSMVEKGVMGNLMEVETNDGTTVYIYVE